ncbi:MAG: FAD-dependent oxidoreductase, partial [Phycisphaerales bacterium]|nr:FAD-dependent oxidoreductase [Phycisphaerales bacterium]
IVAYGGWSMDDHHPAGLYYPGKPTIFHPAPAPYGIAYRTLFSANVPNLLMAGRNISVTHAALSSTRVMGTTSILGQAAGTAAALCVKHRCTPADLFPERIKELQRVLMEDDCWLPGLERPRNALTLAAKIVAEGRNVAALTDGHDRPIGEDDHRYQGPLHSPITLTWSESRSIAGLRLVCDSDLCSQKRMPASYRSKKHQAVVPPTMLRSFRIESRQSDGSWQTVHQENNNYQRLVQVGLEVKTKALRLTPLATWGGEEVHIQSLDVLETFSPKATPAPQGRPWLEIVAEVPAADLAAPDSGRETTPI